MYRIPQVEPYAALLLTLLASTSAYAQATASGSASATLPELSVQGTGTGGGSVTVPSAGSVTVPSVAEQRAAVNSTVGSVEFIDAKEFQNRYANTLRDVLKDTPGVYVQE